MRDLMDLAVTYNDVMSTPFKDLTIRHMAYIMDYVEALEESLDNSKDGASYPSYGNHNAE